MKEHLHHHVFKVISKLAGEQSLQVYAIGGFVRDLFLKRPSKDIDIFYPSVSGSFVFSELWRPGWMSFGKLRAGWANVGGDV
ncbi:MAG: hypothetical protein EOP51_24360, partial [Sphingobacteriales bacterium]